MTAPTTVDTRSYGTLGAVVTRADGAVVDLGTISAQYESPFRQAWWVLVGRPLANRRIRRFNRTNLAIRKALEDR